MKKFFRNLHSLYTSATELSARPWMLALFTVLVSAAVCIKVFIPQIGQLPALALCVIWFAFCPRDRFAPAIALAVALSVWLSVYYVFAISLALFVIRFPRAAYGVIKERAIWCIVIIIALDFVSILWGGFSIYGWLRLAIMLFGTTFFMFAQEGDVSDSVIFAFSVGYVAVGAASLGVVERLTSFGTFLSTYRLGSATMWALLKDTHYVLMQENNLALYSVAVFAMMLTVMKRRGIRPIPVSVALFAAVIGLLTQSRMAVLLLVGVAVFFFVIIVRESKRPALISAIAGGTALLGIAAVVILMPDLVTKLIGRLTSSDPSNGRVGLFFDYIFAIFKNPRYILSGAGMQNYYGLLGVWGSCHNYFEETFAAWGTVGFATAIYMTWREVKRCMPFIRWDRIYLIAPIAAALIGAQTLQFLSLYTLMLPALLSVPREDSL